jgi:hypothetical protein
MTLEVDGIIFHVDSLLGHFQSEEARFGVVIRVLGNNRKLAVGG